MSWRDADRFCQWLSKRKAKRTVFKQKAEWEFAARVGTTTHLYTGDTLPEAFLKNAQNSQRLIRQSLQCLFVVTQLVVYLAYP